MEKAFETTHYIKSGWGFWDTTQYPIGGKFGRAKEEIPVEVVDGPHRTDYGYLVKFKTEDGRQLFAGEDSFRPAD